MVLECAGKVREALHGLARALALAKGRQAEESLAVDAKARAGVPTTLAFSSSRSKNAQELRPPGQRSQM